METPFTGEGSPQLIWPSAEPSPSTKSFERQTSLCSRLVRHLLAATKKRGQESLLIQ